jgi:hypothetical protein
MAHGFSVFFEATEPALWLFFSGDKETKEKQL